MKEMFFVSIENYACTRHCNATFGFKVVAIKSKIVDVIDGCFQKYSKNLVSDKILIFKERRKLHFKTKG